MPEVTWNIGLEGRNWGAGEAFERWALTPEKLEMFDGKLYWTDEEREVMLGLLLENVGAARGVRLGKPEVWRAAVQALA